VTTETGAALLLATDELDDLAICDRVIVLVRGEHFTEFTEPPFNREALIAATEGMTRDPAGHGTSNGGTGTSAEPAGAEPASGTDTQPDSGRQGPP
jgi:simple sugar transport system ATP-binding protein